MTEDITRDDHLADEQVEDFDAFWQQAGRKRRQVRIMGETVTLPAALPLQFQLEAKRLQGSRDDDDVAKLLAILFGEDVLSRWQDRMDIEQLGVLLVWAPLLVSGQDITLEQARQMYHDKLREQASGANPTKRRKR